MHGRGGSRVRRLGFSQEVCLTRPYSQGKACHGDTNFRLEPRPLPLARVSGGDELMSLGPWIRVGE